MHLPARTMSSREFNQATGIAKVAALAGPVYVTDRGRPSHVLLSYDHYRRITNGTRTLADAMGSKADPGDMDLELPERNSVGRAAAFD